MRKLINKRSSTKAERRFHEILKKNHVPFKHRVIVAGREIDFIVGKYAVEIDGHDQDNAKNKMLVEHGYTPWHITNKVLQETPQEVEDILKKLLCLKTTTHQRLQS